MSRLVVNQVLNVGKQLGSASRIITKLRIRPSITRGFSTNSGGPSSHKPEGHSNSGSHEHSAQDLEHLRIKLVRASILHIKSEGFSEQAIAKACDDLDLSSASAKLIENGPLAMINYLNASWNESLALGMDNLVNGGMSRKEKVRASHIQPYIDRWDEAMAWMSHPANLLSAHETMLTFASQVLSLAGDDSSRMDWYLKRYQLIGILTATELYMLTDRSPGFTETYAFLDRALDTADLGDQLLSQVSNTLFGLWKAKNTVFEATKDPFVNPETKEMKDNLDKQTPPNS